MLNDATFAVFVATNQGILRTYAASLGVPWDSVDEIAHESFVQYFLGQSRRPDHVEPLRWLKSITRNCAMVWFRTRKNSARWVALSEMLEPDDQSDAQDLGSAVSVTALKACLESLPDRSRQVLDWYYLHELATEDIAERLRQTASSIRMQVMRMRESLSECIRRRLSQGQAV